MKAKYKKIIAFSLAAAVIAAVSAYTWLPGTKTVARQGVKAAKPRRPTTCRRMPSMPRTSARSSQPTARRRGPSCGSRTTPKRILSSNTAKPATTIPSCSSRFQ